MEGWGGLVVFAVALAIFFVWRRNDDEKMLNLLVGAIASRRSLELASGDDKEADKLLELQEAIQDARAAVLSKSFRSLSPLTRSRLLSASSPFFLEPLMSNYGANHLAVYAAVMRLAGQVEKGCR